MPSTLVLAGLAGIAATLFAVAASVLLTKASNLSPAVNIAIGGVAALMMALLLYLLVWLVARAAFG